MSGTTTSGGRKVSRNLLYGFVGVIVLVSIAALIFGVDGKESPGAKKAAMKKEQAVRAAANEDAMTTEMAAKQLEEMEIAAKKAKENEDKEIERKALEASLNSLAGKRRPDASGTQLSPPGTPLNALAPPPMTLGNLPPPGDIDPQIEAAKRAADRAPGFTGKTKPKTMVAYEDGAKSQLDRITDPQGEQSLRPMSTTPPARAQPTPQQMPVAGYGAGADSALYQNQGMGNLAGGAKKGGGEDPNEKWLNQRAIYKPGTAESIKAVQPSGKYMLMQGTVLSGVMQTALNSKLPGQVVVRVTQDVYDSIYGNVLLMPKGTVMTGGYNTDVNDGQARVMMAINRLIYPSGVSVSLGAMPASDPIGQAGIPGDVNNYWFDRIGATLILAKIAEAVTPNNVTIVGTTSTSSQNDNKAVGTVLSEYMERVKTIRPDITVPHGSKITLILSRDLDFPPKFVFRSAN